MSKEELERESKNNHYRVSDEDWKNTVAEIESSFKALFTSQMDGEIPKATQLKQVTQYIEIWVKETMRQEQTAAIDDQTMETRVLQCYWTTIVQFCKGKAPFKRDGSFEQLYKDVFNPFVTNRGYRVGFENCSQTRWRYQGISRRASYSQ